MKAKLFLVIFSIISFSVVTNTVFAANLVPPGDSPLPNLKPYTPAGWSNPIKPSSLTSGNITIEAAWENNGTAAAESFYTNLYLDGVLIESWGLATLAGGSSTTRSTDKRVTAGPHTLRLVVDITKRVDEQNENDNSFEFEYTWAASTALYPSAPIITGSSPSDGSTINPGPTPLSLSWDSVQGADHYQWKLSPDSSGAGVRSLVSGTGFYDQGETLEPNTTYTLGVQACFTPPNGCSDFSNITFYTSGSGGGRTGGNGGSGGTSSSKICPDGAICVENPLSANTFQELLDAIIDFIFWLGITIAPVIFIIAGFLYVTAVGDTKRIETAKQMMLYAVIGIAVLLLARGLVAVLKSVIGVQ